MIEIPVVGSQVQIETVNIDRYSQAWEHTVKHKGTVVPAFPWLGKDYVCITSGDPRFPIRSILIQNIVKIGGVDGNAVETTVHVPEKTGTWTVPGSKGATYVVTRSNAKWTCDCVAGQFNRMCKHVKAIQEKEA